jgi:hypothetical protein
MLYREMGDSTRCEHVPQRAAPRRRDAAAAKEARRREPEFTGSRGKSNHATTATAQRVKQKNRPPGHRKASTRAQP